MGDVQPQSEPQQKKKEPSYFVSTNQYGEYWKTSSLSFTVLYFLTLIPFTGFFGIDHLYARSPKTALLKAITNCFTFGWWYIYDLLQVILRPEQVKTFGFSAPLVGPLGVGAGQFSGSKKGSEKNLRFFIYALLIMFVPFGIDYFYVGRYLMGFVKLFCTCFILLLPIALLIGLWNIIKLFFITGSILDHNFEFLGSNPSAKYLEYLATTSYAQREFGIFGWIYEWIIAFLQSDLILAIPIVGPFIQLTTASLNTATVAVDAASTTISTAKVAAVEIMEAAKQTAKGVAAVAGHAGHITSAFHPESTQSTIRAVQSQSGGGNAQTNFIGMFLIGVLILTFVSGGVIGISRVIQRNNNERSNESASQEKYDRPPDARSS